MASKPCAWLVAAWKRSDPAEKRTGVMVALAIVAANWHSSHFLRKFPFSLKSEVEAGAKPGGQGAHAAGVSFSAAR